MTETDLSFLPLKVRRVGAGGKRTFEPEGKRRLIEVSCQAGVSVSGMALKAGINANQLRKWIRASERMGTVPPLPAFLPVVTIDDATRPSPAGIPCPPAHLTARLPNGITIELACSEEHGPLLRTMLEALGAPGCSASTRR